MNCGRKAVSLGFATNTLLGKTEKSGAVEGAYHLAWKKNPERKKRRKPKERYQLVIVCFWGSTVVAWCC